MDLVETYSYTRKYERGAYLTSHTDRPSCEISATLCLDYQTDDNKPWKIWLQNDENYLNFNDSKKLIEITQEYHQREEVKVRVYHWKLVISCYIKTLTFHTGETL